MAPHLTKVGRRIGSFILLPPPTYPSSSHKEIQIQDTTTKSTTDNYIHCSLKPLSAPGSSPRLHSSSASASSSSNSRRQISTNINHTKFPFQSVQPYSNPLLSRCFIIRTALRPYSFRYPEHLTELKNAIYWHQPPITNTSNGSMYIGCFCICLASICVHMIYQREIIFNRKSYVVV